MREVPFGHVPRGGVIVRELQEIPDCSSYGAQYNPAQAQISLSIEKRCLSRDLVTFVPLLKSHASPTMCVTKDRSALAHRTVYEPESRALEHKQTLCKGKVKTSRSEADRVVCKG